MAFLSGQIRLDLRVTMQSVFHVAIRARNLSLLILCPKYVAAHYLSKFHHTCSNDSCSNGVSSTYCREHQSRRKRSSERRRVKCCVWRRTRLREGRSEFKLANKCHQHFIRHQQQRRRWCRTSCQRHARISYRRRKRGNNTDRRSMSNS